MKKSKNAFTDYYSQHKISPVSQDISDLEKHFRRRGALYNSLGVTPLSLRARKVIEFGPGSGHNALYTASLSPSLYCLVDGNPTGLKRTKELLEQNRTEQNRTEQNRTEQNRTLSLFFMNLYSKSLI